MTGLTERQGATTQASPVAFWGGAGLLAGIALVAQLPLYDRGLIPMDEGHLLAAADALASGKRLYADVHTGIFPGIYLIATALLEVFGRDALVLRWAGLVVNLTSALALYSIAYRMVALHWSWLPPLLYLALIAVGFPVLTMFNYSTLSLSFGLVALVFLLRYLEAGRLGDGIAMGFLIAAAALTKQNFGALIFAGLLAGLLVNRRESALAERTAAHSLLPIAAAGLALTTVVGLYLARQGVLLALLDSTIFSLASSQLNDFNNPIPPIFGAHPSGDGRFIFLYSPPTLFNALVHGVPFAGLEITPGLRSLSIRASYGLPIAALIAAPTLLFFTRHGARGSARNAARAVVLFAVIFAPGIFPSAIWSHLAFVMIPILLLFAFLGDGLEKILKRKASMGSVWGWRVFIGGLTLAALVIAARTSSSVMDFHPEPLGLEGASVQVSQPNRALIGGAVAFIQDCAEPGEPILVLPDIPILYFLTDRPNPSPFDLAIPGNVDGHLIIERSEAAGVRCAILNPRMYPEFPPFEQLFPDLARYVETRFQPVREIRGGGTHWIGLVRRAP
ncbi:MAG TPA: hypothetical protein EYQ54_00715 [Myxococcales bacterium]|nr:hypothetical protein [Myxococcales bacterium]